MRRSPSTSEAANVMVPTLPTNIRTSSTSCPAAGSCAVIPVDRPVVLKAEMT